MAEDTVKVTTKSTERDAQNDNVYDEICAKTSDLSGSVQDLDRAISCLETSPQSEEETEEVNAVTELLKLSELGLESGKSVESSLVPEYSINDGISTDRKTVKAKLSEALCEVGGSSTKQDDQNDDICGVMCTNALKLIRCIRDVNRTIALISEEEGMAVYAASKLWKPDDHDFVKKKLSELKQNSIDDRMSTDPKIFRRKMSEALSEVGGSSVNQDDQSDDISGVLRTNTLNLIHSIKDMNRTIERMKATLMSEEEGMAVNAAIELWKPDDHDFVKMKLSELKQKSINDDISTDRKIVKAKLIEALCDLGGSSTKQDGQNDGVMYGNLWNLIFCIKNMNCLIQRMKADQDRVRNTLRQLELQNGQSSRLSTKQDNQNNDMDNEIGANISNHSRDLQDGGRTITSIEAIPMSEEEAKEVNAELELLKAGHDNLKKELRKLVMLYVTY